MMKDDYHAIRHQRGGQRCQFEPPGVFFGIVYTGAAPPPGITEKQNAIVSGLGRSYRRPVILLVPGRSVGPFSIVNPESVRPPRHGVAAPPICFMPNMLVTGARINIEWRRRAARIGARVKRDPAMGVQIYKPQTANLAADLRVTIAMRAFAEQRYAALNLRTLHLHRPGQKELAQAMCEPNTFLAADMDDFPAILQKSTKVAVSKFPSR